MEVSLRSNQLVGRNRVSIKSAALTFKAQISHTLRCAVPVVSEVLTVHKVYLAVVVVEVEEVVECERDGFVRIFVFLFHKLVPECYYNLSK